ncbi:MAG TPA: multiheme c-type cytochrome [Chitinophagaceae bacterium]|nr:multiheme c-type cytochrome [Chitinophagaceae bacterium]
MRAIVLFSLFGLSLGFVLFNCNSEEKELYLNTQKGKATYVGMETCKSCHLGIFETFIQTGMGQSWGLANKAKSAADYSSAKGLVYDSVKDFYYKPYWDGDSLAILEYRLLGKDTVHKRTEKVSYIVGSGQHTNSHLININGYLHQAPITFYTQKGKWDLAPGFEKGMNTRFDRKIEMECITCHNGYPDLVEGSLNKYTNIPLGIDCERCHGPGSLHVTDKQNGNIVDTSKFSDYTIVNPGKLSTEQQNNLCQRCHLQGIAVLNDGKSFSDFMPSHQLNKTMNVFMPSYSGGENNMIMASHVERMKMSNCYVNSGKMSCINCHNPHISVKFTPQEQYINACKNCHGAKDDCSESLANRNAKSDNCITCHMPKNGSIDIPHVAVTDHFIRRKPQVENKNEIAKFLGLVCYNNDQMNAKTMARAYLEFYERYESNRGLVDSAFYYLTKAGIDTNKDADFDLIRAYFLIENFEKITKLANELDVKNISDAWTCYRIGEAYLKQKNVEKSIGFLLKSVALKPLSLDFQNKLGLAYLEANNLVEAKKVFLFVQNENPKLALTQSHLGYIAMQENNLPLAKKYLLHAIMLNPDHVQTIINVAVVYHQTGNDEFIKPILYHALKLDPMNQQVKAMLGDLK